MSKIVRLALCLMFVFMSSLVVLNPQTSFAKPKGQKQVKKEEAVYATERGKKYHKEDCRFLKNRDTIELSLEEATDKGLTPCGWCFKEEERENEEED
ncbi:MAG: hypothetical protein ISS47_02035 [Candidatus Omnitrophica bacterium]|nr:hypothetical protein [Candidatus Omnitrophota bacterium]